MPTRCMGTDGETPSLPDAGNWTVRHHPYQVQGSGRWDTIASDGRPPPSRPTGAAHLPVGPVSLGPSPPRPTAQGTDGETPSLPTAAHLPVGPESLGPSPPHPAAQGTDGETPSLPNQRASGPNLHERPPSRCHLPVGPESLGPSPPRPAAQGTDGETPSLPNQRPQAAATPGRARVSRAIPALPDSPGNGR